MRKTIARALGLATLCVALFASASPAQGAPSHPFLFSIAKLVPEPNVTERFEGPCGLAVDKSGALYVSDYYHDKIDVFSSAASFLTQLKEVEAFDGPCSLAVDTSGALFVNVLHRSVTRFIPAAFPIVAKGSYGAGTAIDTAHPTGVAVDPASGHVYVDDRDRVSVYEPSGAAVEEGGEALQIGLGTLEDGYGVAVSAFPATSGFVYVADAATDAIEVYDPATDKEAPIQTIDGKGTPQGGFPTLRDAALAVDQSTGHIFLAYNSQGSFYEHPKAAVAEFNAAGEYRGTLPAPTPLWFGEPSGIAVDNSAAASQGRVYVTTGNSQFETAGLNPERQEESAVYAFGPSTPGQRLQASLAGAGAGTVKSSPAGIACPGACGAEYDEGTLVKLSATPDPGSAFAGWSGDCVGTGACTVTMSAAKAVLAEFEVAPVSAAIGTGGEKATAAQAAASPAAAGAQGVPHNPPSPSARRGAKPRGKRARRRHRRAKQRHRPANGGKR